MRRRLLMTLLVAFAVSVISSCDSGDGGFQLGGCGRSPVPIEQVSSEK